MTKTCPNHHQSNKWYPDIVMYDNCIKLLWSDVLKAGNSSWKKEKKKSQNNADELITRLQRWRIRSGRTLGVRVRCCVSIWHRHIFHHSTQSLFHYFIISLHCINPSARVWSSMQTIDFLPQSTANAFHYFNWFEFDERNWWSVTVDS